MVLLVSCGLATFMSDSFGALKEVSWALRPTNRLAHDPFKGCPITRRDDPKTVPALAHFDLRLVSTSFLAIAKIMTYFVRTNVLSVDPYVFSLGVIVHI